MEMGYIWRQGEQLGDFFYSPGENSQEAKLRH